MDRWRLLAGVWRCRSCAARLNHTCNPQIRQAASRKNRKHGDSINVQSSGHWLYARWQRMKNRVRSSETYILKGVKVCEEWAASYETFKQWCEDNGARPELELDRINNLGDYEPANCRWITHAENCRNKGPRRKKSGLLAVSTV